jgi:glutathione S-transferase
MITLYHFADDWGFDPSPFCLKLETYLKFARVPFEKRISLVAFMRAPKKKLPYIVDDGQVVDDSQGIIEYLQRNYDVSLDSWLTPSQRAAGHAVRRMLEDGTYWILIYSRWMEDKNWRRFRPVLFGAIPSPLQSVMAGFVRRDYKRRLYGQGLSRHDHNQIYAIGANDIDSISVLLGDNEFFFGDKVSSVDAVIYGFLGNAFYAPMETPPKATIAKYPNLVAYLNRIREIVQVPPTSKANAATTNSISANGVS